MSGTTQAHANVGSYFTKLLSGLIKSESYNQIDQKGYKAIAVNKIEWKMYGY